MDYKNDRGYAIYLTEMNVVIPPYGTLKLDAKQQAMPAVKKFIEDKVLVPLTAIGNVILPAGVKAGPDEFGTLIVDGVYHMPGTGEAKTLEEVITTKSNEAQKGMEEIGKELEADHKAAEEKKISGVVARPK